MQAEKEILFGQILDEFLASGNREEAVDQLSLTSSMHNQKVIGVIYQATENHRVILDPETPHTIISTLDNERRLAAQEDKGEGRLKYWEKVGLAYSGPDQTLPKGMMYMDGGLYVNCSDDLFLGAYDGKGSSITIGSENEPDLLTLAFPSKENLEQIIAALQGIANTMEPTPCSSSTDA